LSSKYAGIIAPHCQLTAGILVTFLSLFIKNSFKKLEGIDLILYVLDMQSFKFMALVGPEKSCAKKCVINHIAIHPPSYLSLTCHTSALLKNNSKRKENVDITWYA